MAKIYFNSNGQIIRLIQNSQEQKRYPNPPKDSVQSIDFDEDTNKLLINNIKQNCNDHILISGVLFNNSQLVNISSSGQPNIDKQKYNRIKQKIDRDQILLPSETSTILRIILNEIMDE